MSNVSVSRGHQPGEIAQGLPVASQRGEQGGLGILFKKTGAKQTTNGISTGGLQLIPAGNSQRVALDEGFHQERDGGLLDTKTVEINEIATG